MLREFRSKTVVPTGNSYICLQLFLPAVFILTNVSSKNFIDTFLKEQADD